MSTTIIAQTVGVDISKLTLDVYLHPQASARQFPNTAVGIKALLAWLGQTEIHRVIFEPTGAYHRSLERQLGDADIAMVKVNPLQARRFAEAIGQRAKTDAVDAAMLARFGALDALQTRPVISQTLSDMKALLVARRGLVKDRVAATNRHHVQRAPLLKRLADQRLRQVERQIAAIDAALRALCRADAEMTARLDILVSIPAIGEATALTMLIEMPELGTMDNKAVASLAGLAPVARDSGQHRGKRFIRAGRAHLQPGPLHARPGRHPVQRRHEGQISGHA
jgi:transposase